MSEANHVYPSEPPLRTRRASSARSACEYYIIFVRHWHIFLLDFSIFCDSAILLTESKLFGFGANWYQTLRWSRKSAKVFLFFDIGSSILDRENVGGRRIGCLNFCQFWKSLCRIETTVTLCTRNVLTNFGLISSKNELAQFITILPKIAKLKMSKLSNLKNMFYLRICITVAFKPVKVFLLCLLTA